MLKHGCYWKWQCNKYMFNVIDIFMPVSGSVGRGPLHSFARARLCYQDGLLYMCGE